MQEANGIRRRFSLDDIGESAGEARGVDAGGVGAEHRAERPGDVGARPRLLGVEQPVVGIRMTEGAVRVDSMLRVLQSDLRHRESRPAALVEVGVDTLLLERGADHVDGLEAGALVAHHRVVAMVRHEALAATRQPAVAPTAVAARGPETRDVALDDHDAERRIELGQVVGGPEAGEASADDRDVRLGVTG